jgi:hypothetical protein
MTVWRHFDFWSPFRIFVAMTIFLFKFGLFWTLSRWKNGFFYRWFMRIFQKWDYQIPPFWFTTPFWIISIKVLLWFVRRPNKTWIFFEKSKILKIVSKNQFSQSTEIYPPSWIFFKNSNGFELKAQKSIRSAVRCWENKF